MPDLAHRAMYHGPACSWVARHSRAALSARLKCLQLLAQNELITRLGAGGQAGRAATAEKALERMREEGLVGKPFVPKKRSFAFPAVDRMGCARSCLRPIPDSDSDNNPDPDSKPGMRLTLRRESEVRAAC